MNVRLYGSAPPGLLTGEPVIGSGYAFSSLERTFAGEWMISYRRLFCVFVFGGCVVAITNSFVPLSPLLGINGNRDHDGWGCGNVIFMSLVPHTFFPHDCRFLTLASATGPNVVVTGALAPQGRARSVRSGNIALAHFLRRSTGSSDPRPQTENKWTLLLPMGAPAPTTSPSLHPHSLPLSRGHTVITPCRNHLSPCMADKTNSSWIPPRHIRALMLIPQTHGCRPLLLWKFSPDSVLLLRVARANVSHCTCDVLLAHNRSASPSHVACSTHAPFVSTKFLKLLFRSSPFIGSPFDIVLAPGGSGSVENSLFGSTFCIRCT
jgi:hypothetical protein